MKNLDKDTFIVRSNTIHNNKYSYKKNNFSTIKDKVLITCPLHGEFEQVASYHLSGRGCSKCSKVSKINTSEFINLDNRKHNYKYKYDKSIYVNKKTKLIIICLEQGEFEQIADNHLRGNGCIYCSGKKKLNKEQFIEKANKKHNYKYDYSITEYINSKSKVSIICPVHGEFRQSVNNHLTGYGCSKCANNLKSSNIEFVEKCKKIHDSKYSYDKLDYINSKQKVIVICTTHGEFEISPSNHLKGVGCSKCSNKYKPTTSEFIEKCKNIHSNKYDYSCVFYKNNINHIKIICPYHGEFKQRPSHHLNGVGCPNCVKSSGEQLIESYFNKNSINFKFQHQFDDLKIKKHLRFDFAVFDDIGDLKFLLEFNGIQHYSKKSKFHKCEKDFEDSILRDKMKLDYCYKNNIKLYIIKYNDDLELELKKIIEENEEENRV
jgi:hypothetical protein